MPARRSVRLARSSDREAPRSNRQQGRSRGSALGDLGTCAIKRCFFVHRMSSASRRRVPVLGLPGPPCSHARAWVASTAGSRELTLPRATRGPRDQPLRGESHGAGGVTRRSRACSGFTSIGRSRRAAPRRASLDSVAAESTVFAPSAHRSNPGSANRAVRSERLTTPRPERFGARRHGRRFGARGARGNSRMLRPPWAAVSDQRSQPQGSFADPTHEASEAAGASTPPKENVGCATRRGGGSGRSAVKRVAHASGATRASVTSAGISGALL